MLHLKTTIDHNSGFCFGVVYAIEMAEDFLAENEVKELLAVMGKKGEGQILHMAVNLSSNSNDVYEANVLECEIEIGSGVYFYEPNHALIKSGLWKPYAFQQKMKLAATNCPYLFSDIQVNNFQGRSFKVVEILPYKPSVLKKYFAANSIRQANIGRRNFQDETALIRKKLGLKDGGETYLFFAKMESHVCIVCEKIFTN